MDSDQSKLLKVSIVEDHDIFRKRLVELLQFYPELEVVLVAESAESFLQKIKRNDLEQQPEVVLMDIELPGISGIEATFQLKQDFPGVEVIMFTVFEDDERIFESINVGASGYLLKDTAIEEVVNSIKEIHNGGSPISPSIAKKVLDMVKNPEAFHAAPQQEIPFDLSPAELKILQHVVDGKTNKQIAEDVFLSPWTVKTHIKNIYKKMHVNSRAAAVKMALRRNLA
ncbi:MAG: response regulator transcription factor [Balneolaceae bacterium]|nr:response regulator transcription factor [Balneolaceae bacterium]MBO6545425.1 response regulator transcription factor [Balneolaceae bacterium]MBO6646821.1 response regulator transcription factor [Balneolaceae bacterium]